MIKSSFAGIESTKYIFSQFPELGLFLHPLIRNNLFAVLHVSHPYPLVRNLLLPLSAFPLISLFLPILLIVKLIFPCLALRISSKVPRHSSVRISVHLLFPYFPVSLLLQCPLLLSLTLRSYYHLRYSCCKLYLKGLLLSKVQAFLNYIDF